MEPCTENATNFLKDVAQKPELAEQLASVNSPQEMLAIAKSVGYELDNNDLSAAMRSIAAATLKQHGLPHWAIDSMFLGESVCW